MMTVRQAFEQVLKGRSLDAAESEGVFSEILDNVVPEVLVAAFLIALRMKGETAGELAGGTRSMRQRARALKLLDHSVSNPAPVKLLDTAGTGGDNAGTFNISTGAAMIAATAGIPTAKHGNRAVSGRVGAADVLESFGVRLELEPPGLQRCLDQARICFVFAPAYHPVLSRLAALRRNLGTRTIFNLMAPMANPARPSYQLLGVAEPRLMRPVAEALAMLAIEHALVVHGNDGLDEISIAAPTSVIEVRDGKLEEYTISPEMFGLNTASARALLIEDRRESMELLRRTMSGDPGPARDVLALNAGAAIYAGNGAPTLAEGVQRANDILGSGRALETIEKLRVASHQAAVMERS
ncbi:MAG TPA: anthranilate phosphoribosyltransferase [Candidatus Binataceae bacterium]|nr:anthranilate phosphoribosyltransferase [Candidatus Binataceae bacterium]